MKDHLNLEEFDFSNMELRKSEKPGVRWAEQIAGLFMILNSVVLLIHRVQVKSVISGIELPSAIVAIVIGLFLIARKEWAKIWAIISISLGLIIWVFVALLMHQYRSAVFNLLSSGSLLLLLLGSPGRRRAFAGVSLYILASLLSAFCTC